jgi:hypothetical protein
LITLLLISSFNISADDVAICTGLSGYSYYMDYGVVPKESAGWTKDEMDDFQLKVTRDSNGKFDILFKDQIGYASSLNDGATITPSIRTNDSLSLISNYPNQTTEIYSFWKNRDGKLKYSLAQVKNGTPLIRKNTLFVGNCSILNFNI